jgi:hypothetical protein
VMDENCALLDYYAASNGKSLRTFRENLSGQSSTVKNPIILGFLTLKMGLMGCTETSARGTITRYLIAQKSVVFKCDVSYNI